MSEAVHAQADREVDLDAGGNLPQELELHVCLDALVSRQGPKVHGEPLLEDLKALLKRLAPAAAGPLEARLDWLEQLVRWLRARRSGLGGGAQGALSSARLRLLLEAIRQMPRQAEALSALFAGALAGTRGLSLFAETGLPKDQGFAGESWDRLLGKFLPTPPDAADLAQLVARLFPRPRDADWLEELAPELASELAALVRLREHGAPLREAMADALTMLSARACALGLSTEVRERGIRAPLAEDPFLRLPRACDAFVVALRAGNDASIATAARACRAALSHCGWAVAAVHAHLEESGTSVELVWRLERTVKSLDRAAALMAVLAPEPGGDASAAALRLVAGLVRDRLEDRSLRSLLRRSLDKLARKVIERAGQSGEHYITRTRMGWHDMLSSAAGGGLITAGTVALKCAIAALGLPIFFEGLASSFNYAGSFLLMQALGFTLATKQPAFTAAALAAEMRPTAGPKPGKRHIDVHALVELIARITRSQMAAVVGNLGMVLPAALALDALSRLVRGRPVLDAEAAHHYVLSLHPTHSGTIAYAALTGLMLWLASLGAGWLENWVVFRRLPEALAGSPALRRVRGPGRAERLGAIVLRHAAGMGASITLGALLGMLPALGRFFGAPLEVRHVTLSTGALALAGSALGPTHVLDGAFLSAMLGIVLIALLNFGVSFAMALTVALKGREASGKDRLALLRALAARLVRAPLSFVLPPRQG